MKPCTVCGGVRDNGTSQCRSCRAKAMREYRATPEGKEATRATEAKRKNKEERKLKGNVIRAEYMRSPKGKEVAAEACARYRAKNKQKLREYEKHRRANDSLFRLRANLRRRLREILRSKEISKPASVFGLIGCNLDEFKQHISNQFSDGMSWGNYGEWELDHIYPVSAAKNQDDIRKLFHFSNIQPLWSIDNKRKQNKILYPSVRLASDSRISATTSSKGKYHE